MKGIADTGFLVAFANTNDKHHAWPVQIAADVTEPLLICEAVMAETAFHLKSTAVALAMLNEGLVSLAFDCRDHLDQLTRLADRYAEGWLMSVQPEVRVPVAAMAMIRKKMTS